MLYKQLSPFTIHQSLFTHTRSPLVLFLLLLTFYLLSFTSLRADHIIPTSDPVYEFLEMTNTLKLSDHNHHQYPLYYNEIIKTLEEIANVNVLTVFLPTRSNVYQRQALFHLKRMKLDYVDGTEIAVWYPNKIPKKIGGLFRKNPEHQRLITIADPLKRKDSAFPVLTYLRNETNIYVSGILGYEYDYKEAPDLRSTQRGTPKRTETRMRQYYGVETAGNFTDNFGFYLAFRKGHYTGDDAFIRENPFITKMGDMDEEGNIFKDGENYYQVDLTSEVSFKNPYLNLAAGYGTFDIGRSITSSIILNSDTTPYGYFKIDKRFGIFEYTGITTQLIPDSLKSDVPYLPKSMALQTLSLQTKAVTLGVGNTIIYGDRSFDIAYSSPLALYMIMDSKNHGRDNTLAFGYGELRPFKGLNLYGNFLFDDIKNARFGTNKWLCYGAYQGGLSIQLPKFPLELSGEATAVGPSTYSHKSEGFAYGRLTYIHDDMFLGHREGSNLFSVAGRMRMHFSRWSLGFLYENIQQGDIANDPALGGYHEEPFLADNISRKQYITTSLDLRLIPELRIFGNYRYNNIRGRETHYVFSGAEFRY